jgi:hypothetical protein
MKLTKRAMIIPVASLLLLSGCAQPSAYKDPISTFQTASTVVIEGAMSEYQAINKRERDALIDMSIADKKEINISILNNTALLTKEDFDARMAALNALANHGKLLFKLANSNAPEEAKQAVNSLDDALLKLSNSLGKASPDDGFKDKAGAFATIAGEVTKLVLNAKIDKALEKAIILSETDVLALITLIEDEMAKFRLRQESATRPLARLLAINEFNEEVKKTSPDQNKLKGAGVRIKQSEDAWEELEYLPEPGFEKMKQAHQELVNYAKKKDKSPEDLAGLVAAMDAFADQAKIIADAIKTLQQ